MSNSPFFCGSSTVSCCWLTRYGKIPSCLANMPFTSIYIYICHTHVIYLSYIYYMIYIQYIYNIYTIYIQYIYTQYIYIYIQYIYVYIYIYTIYIYNIYIYVYILYVYNIYIRHLFNSTTRKPNCYPIGRRSG